MAKQFKEIGAELEAWLADQHVFFVATAPLSPDGHVNCSPKGTDSFRVIGPREVMYLDYTGSGAETIAHLRENGRIVLMFCAFEGAPQILRIHGTGTLVFPSDEAFPELLSQFSPGSGVRAIAKIDVTRISTSCGYGVPEMPFQRERSQMERWATSKGSKGLARYRKEYNAVSIDGLPAMEGLQE